MGRDGTVSGVYTGDRRFTGKCSFDQGVGNITVKHNAQKWYVDSGKTAPAVSGDGLSPIGAFLTLAEAVAAAGDYDVILVAENSIETIATGGIEITQTGLTILGENGANGRQAAALKITAGTSPMFTILADRVEIAGLTLSCRIAYPVFCIGSVADGVGTAFYQTWIHDCNIDGAGTATFGVAMGGAGGFGVATQCDAVNTVIENNHFAAFVTAAVVVSGTRMSVINNTFNVPVDTIGISVVETGTNRGFWRVNDNLFSGIANSSTTAIKFAGNTTQGQGAVMRNLLAGTWDTTITDNTGDIGVLNYVGSTTGGSLIDFNSSA